MTTDTQVGDQWGAESAVEFRVTLPWRKAGCEGWRVRDARKRIRLGEYDSVEVRYSDGQTATFPAAPDAVNPGEPVGTSNASEPKTSPHPIRGEGEPVAWQWRYGETTDWYTRDDRPDWFDDERDNPLREKVARIIEPSAWTAKDFSPKWEDVSLTRAVSAPNAIDRSLRAADQILQALQSASGK